MWRIFYDKECEKAYTVDITDNFVYSWSDDHGVNAEFYVVSTDAHTRMIDRFIMKSDFVDEEPPYPFCHIEATPVVYAPTRRVYKIVAMRSVFADANVYGLTLTVNNDFDIPLRATFS